MKLVAAGLSDVGRERDHNEDSYAVDQELELYLVADGMGGHQAGEVASALAIATVVEYVKGRTGGIAGAVPSAHLGVLPGTVPSGLPSALPVAVPSAHPGAVPVGAPGSDRLVVLCDAARQANARVIEEGARNRRRKGMGSTLVAMIRDGDDMGIVHVGDSRCYRYRNSSLERMTRDHSLIEELAGDDPIAHAALGGYSNVITRAIGTAADTEPEFRREKMLEGDVFLLCSDGLSGVVKDPDIARILARGGDLAERCRELVQAANQGGGPDNISTVLVRVEA